MNQIRKKRGCRALGAVLTAVLLLLSGCGGGLPAARSPLTETEAKGSGAGDRAEAGNTEAERPPLERTEAHRAEEEPPKPEGLPSEEEPPEPQELPSGEEPPEPANPEALPAGETVPEEFPSEKAVPDPEIPEEEEIPEELRPWVDRNPYVAACLTAGDGSISGPVVHTPADQNFFLHRDIDGKPSPQGMLFLANPWREGNLHALIYGHNMADGTGFGTLLKYADPAYGAAHPLIRFRTRREEGVYRLLGAFYSEIYDTENLETESERAGRDAEAGAWNTVSELNLRAPYPDHDIYREFKDIEDGHFRYYYYTDLSDPADFSRYVEEVKKASLYETGVEAAYGDQILTLSTCSYQTRNGRFAVVAVRSRP